MRSINAILTVGLLAIVAQCSQGHWHGYNVAHHPGCSPSKDGGCTSCGVDFVQCGPDTCYNPKAGETCCSTTYPCPANSTCSALGPGCIPNNGTHRANCKDKKHVDDDDDSSYANSTTYVASSTLTTAPLTSYTAGDDDDDDSYSSSTTYTTTITSTTTNTITVSGTASSSCALAAATTGLPLTTSLPPYGNATTTALNTTTSTMALTNVSTVLPATASINPNTTKPAATISPAISPAISGYKGAGTALIAQSPTSLFAFGFLVFTAGLLI